jgi:hypothetical protein
VGTTPVRFPIEGDPGDDGWHIDGSFSHDDQYWVNVRSDGRSLLMLFLFSDVAEDDAPLASGSGRIWTCRLRSHLPGRRGCSSAT